MNDAGLREIIDAATPKIGTGIGTERVSAGQD